ncbi:MAG: calcium-translocating P-type ATPase, PMCA-type [Clostridia bacterium]
MKEYLKSTEEVLKAVNSTPNGITSNQAKEVLEKQGPNKLREPKKDGIAKRFFKSLMDPMIIMLLAAAAISAVTAVISGDSFTDVFIILFVVIVNTILGLVQESKAENAIDSLMEMTKATSKVIRDGVIQNIKSEDLVVGDVIVLEAGDAIPADCRILEAFSMKVEEAALTGESVPVTKIVDLINLKENTMDIPLGDRTNMLYSGSTVAYGRGKAVVVATGMETEMGKIAEALQTEKEEKTPLQKKMAEISKVLTKLVVGISVFVFIFGIVKTGDFTGEHILDTFLIAVALAVAAIPEGLPAVVTIILSMGVTSMSKRQALIRKLNAVETLGCTQVICTDKTGTLTQNKMTVVENETSNEKLLAEAMALCSDAEIGPNDKEAIGEPTEAALVNFANKLDLPKYKLEKEAPRIGEAPFDSMRKMMSTVHEKNGKIIQYTKGACEILLERCKSFLDENNNIVPITNEIKEKIKKENKKYADKALRVLGACYKEYDKIPKDFEPDTLEKDLIFIGFVGMIDPCRPEVYDAIKNCRKAGVRPVMITGDHIDTATAIGKDLEIIQDSSEAITGEKLNNLSDEEMIKIVNKCSVFARVQPEHKTKIVKALKSQELVVAMTGDGVNDAPSIKAADIGISMGITGTDVTKGASDMILADDNFATIVNAVEEGRKIYDNIRKVLQFQLATNMAEVLYVFISSAMGITIVTPPQLLWINMVTDSTPGLALGMEKAEGNLMERKPRKSNESVFSGGAAFAIGSQGVIMAIIILASFFIGQHIELGRYGIFESADGMTMAFLTANFIQMFHAICMRSQDGSIFTMKNKNWWLVGSFILCTLLTLGVIYIPVLSNLFGLTSISLKELAVAFGLAFLIVPIKELIKVFQRMHKKTKQA